MMQTCQHCHSVLVSPICCTHISQSPMVLPMNGPTSIPTPSVSGHMFHFPPMHLCHISCPQGCHPQGTFGFQWPDIGGRRSSVDMTIGLERTAATKKALEKSGWYWGSMTWQESQMVLGSTSVGTFFLRDSADPLHVFSISVQTSNGPTSARISLDKGKFKLSSTDSVRPSLPEFSCVIQLVQYYLSAKHPTHMWVDESGKPFSPIWISQCLRKEVPKLSHLCRLVVNRFYPRSVTAARLPSSLAKYLDDYPYWC